MDQNDKTQSGRGGDNRLLLHAWLDNELSLPETIAARAQLAADPTLAAEAKAVLRLKQALQDKLTPQPVPPQLKARVEAAVGLQRRAPRPMWMALAASLVVAVLGSAVATSFVLRKADSDVVYSAIVDSHVRALMATKPVDVVSTDQHTVKPWFNGKSIQSPEVVDTSSQGFPLVGGRIDVIKGTAVPVVVYNRRLHVIDVWALPPALAAEVRGGAKTVSGYNILPFTAHGASYIATSDLAGDELEAFTKLLQN